MTLSIPSVVGKFYDSSYSGYRIINYDLAGQVNDVTSSLSSLSAGDLTPVAPTNNGVLFYSNSRVLYLFTYTGKLVEVGTHYSGLWCYDQDDDTISWISTDGSTLSVNQLVVGDAAGGETTSYSISTSFAYVRGFFSNNGVLYVVTTDYSDTSLYLFSVAASGLTQVKTLSNDESTQSMYAVESYSRSDKYIYFASENWICAIDRSALTGSRVRVKVNGYDASVRNAFYYSGAVYAWLTNSFSVITFSEFGGDGYYIDLSLPDYGFVNSFALVTGALLPASGAATCFWTDLLNVTQNCE